MYFWCLAIIFPKIENDETHYVNTLIFYFINQWCIVLSLVEIDSAFFKILSMYFRYFTIISLYEKISPFSCHIQVCFVSSFVKFRSRRHKSETFTTTVTDNGHILRRHSVQVIQVMISSLYYLQIIVYQYRFQKEFIWPQLHRNKSFRSWEVKLLF